MDRLILTVYILGFISFACAVGLISMLLMDLIICPIYEMICEYLDKKS